MGNQAGRLAWLARCVLAYAWASSAPRRREFERVPGYRTQQLVPGQCGRTERPNACFVADAPSCMADLADPFISLHYDPPGRLTSGEQAPNSLV